MLATFLHGLTLLSSATYGGTVVCFALLVALYPRGRARSAEQVARVFQAAGPVMGLSMGAWVFALLVGRYLARGGLHWSWDGGAARLDLAAWVVFAALWASSFVLEIWTLEPVRVALAGDEPAEVERALRPVRVHLGANAVLFAVWCLLWAGTGG